MLKLVWRYGLAVVTVQAMALLVTRSLEQYTDITPLFYAAVVVSAWFGGLRARTSGCGFSGVAIDYFFVAPLYTLGWDKAN